MPRSMAELTRQLKEKPSKKRAAPKRTRKRRTPPAGSVQTFTRAGELIRKTIYLSREEWELSRIAARRQKNPLPRLSGEPCGKN